MTEAKPRGPRRVRAGTWRRRFQARSRLIFAAGLGVLAALLLPGQAGPMLRAVFGWDVGVLVFLALVLVMIAIATPESTRARARLEDESRWVILAVMAAAALFSMFAILGVLKDARGAGGHLSAELELLAGATILLSWIFVHTTFAVHYAHDFFGSPDRKDKPGLAFPGDQETPDYWDFLYFSFVVGMTCQVSDVQVVTHRSRRLVLAHGVVSFLYNTIVLALSVNLLAGLL